MATQGHKEVWGPGCGTQVPRHWNPLQEIEPTTEAAAGSQRQNGALSVLPRLSQGCHEPYSIKPSGKDAAMFKSPGRVALAWH